MATTTNYGWSTPDDSALVKDGASAIRTLGSSVDTTVKALSPGTTAGDIDYYTSSTAKSRIAIGSSGQVLTVSGGVPSWATASSGAMTLLSTTTLSGTSTTISSISQSYNSLYISISGTFSTGSRHRVQWNGSTTVSFVVSANTSANQYAANGQLISANSSTRPIAWLEMNNYASSSKNKIGTGGWSSDYDDANNQAVGSIMYGSTSAITSITITNDSSATMTGTCLIYGVK
jgi:hypothetical protein